VTSDHRIIAAGPETLTYHPDGQRAADSRHSYDVDALGRVVRVRDAATGAVTAQFTYDALSRVAAGSLDGQAFERSFVGVRWLEEAHGSAGAMRQQSAHPIWPVPLAIIDGAGEAFVHPDGGMSTLCVTDAAGVIRERHRFDPFGSPEVFAADGVTSVSPSAALVEPIWRTMALVPNTGLYFTPQRLYDPGLGVFLDRDPLLYADSPSPYVFASHNPVDFGDPPGRAKSPLSSVSIESKKQRSSVTGHSFDQLNDENAQATAALQAGTGQVPTVDVTQLLENIGPVLNQQERSRAVDAGKRVAQLEKDARDAEAAQIAKELPGTVGSVTPIYGSVQSSRVHVSHGNYVRGVACSALAISDVFLVKAILLGGGKLLVRGVAGLLAVAAEDAAPTLGRGAWAGGETQWGAALRTPAEHELKLSGFRLAPRPAELAIERVYTPRVLQRAEAVGARDLGHNFPRLLDPIIFSSETRYLTRLGGLGRAGSVTYASEGGFVTLTKTGRGLAESVGVWEIGVLETNSGVERIIHRSFTGNVPVL
jgi:RHS repeat-associated protein